MYHHHPSSTMLSSRQLLCTIIIVIAVLSIHSKSINALSPSSRRHLNSNCNDFQDFHASGTQAGKLIQICHDARKKSTRTTTTNNKKAIIVPGIHDALSAKIFHDAGAEVLFLSGFGVSACKLGEPDIGLLTQSEMEDTLRSVVRVAPSCPVIVDGDTGFGGIMNIRRTIRNFASAGAAAVTIEDQVFPKTCTYAAGEGVKVISFEECRDRIKAAIAARDEARTIDGNHVLVVARTDCRAVLGLEEAVARCKMFEAIGADICYAENLQSMEEYEYLRNRLHPATLTMLAQVQLYPNTKNKDQNLYHVNQVGQMGFDLALFGVSALQSVVHATKETASMIFDTTNNGLIPKENFSSFEELKETIGFTKVELFEDVVLNNNNNNNNNNT